MHHSTRLLLALFASSVLASCSNKKYNVSNLSSEEVSGQSGRTVGDAAGYAFDAYISGDSMIGISHVATDASLDHQTLDFGVATAMRLNVKSAFFYLTPNFREKYLQQDFGPSNPKNLTELANLAPYRRAFSKFDIVVLTCTADAFSTTGLSIRDQYLTDEQYAANRKEFSDLTTYLMKTYNGTKKRFILKNWEGDWLLLNGYDENASVPDSRVKNFVRWFKSTQEGIAQARESAASSSDVKVDFALEMNRIATVQAGKSNTFLGSVVPQVPSDWVSYSAWETISNRGNAQDPQSIYNTIVADLSDIKRRAGRPIFISEFGYAESGDQAMQAARTQAAVRGFKDAGIPLAFYWNTYETPYGVFRTDGQRTPNGAFNALRNLAMIEQVNESKYFSSKEATNVTSAYWNVLGRKPAMGEFDYWVKDAAAKDASLIHKYFAQSEEAGRVIVQVYRKYTGLDPDEGSKQYFRSALEGGSTIYDIASWIYLDHLEYASQGAPPSERPTALPSPPPAVLTPVATTPASTPQPTPQPTPLSAGCVGSSLTQGRGLAVGQWLCSTDGRFLLSMQRDGNLVLFQSSQALWASNTNGSGATNVQFQRDGNFVIYSGPNGVWASGTGGHLAAQQIVLQNDGNLVIYEGTNAIWATNTGGR